MYNKPVSVVTPKQKKTRAYNFHPQFIIFTEGAFLRSQTAKSISVIN